MHPGMIDIDGSYGEGGGQILRTALTLSAVTGRSFRIANIRRNRSKPGLLNQHLTCVKAAAEICNAEVKGDEKGSRELLFRPGLVRGGDYSFTVKTAGSALLVFQTVFPALSSAGEPSEIELSGGTHNPMAPPFEFVERIFLPSVADLGFSAQVELKRHGFFPRGQGIVSARINPRKADGSLDMVRRGGLKEMRPVVLIADLDGEIARREARILGRELKRSSVPARIHRLREGEGPGNAVLLEAGYGEARCLFSSIGHKGKRAEAVAREAVEAWRAHHRLEVPVQPELADQLLIPMALARTGRFLTGKLTRHARTNIHIIEMFLGPCFYVKEKKSGQTYVEFREK